MNLIISFVTFFVAAGFGLQSWNVVTSQASFYTTPSIIFSIFSIILAAVSMQKNKTASGSTLLILLNIMSLLMVAVRYGGHNF
jgi:hypothetical protein